MDSKTYPPRQPDEEPDYEPEDCDYCKQNMEQNDIEYTLDCHWTGQTWICDHCGLPL